MNHDGIVPVNVEYVSERFGLLIIITCGESLFAGAAIVASSRSMLSLLMAGLCVYFALLVKLLYFELQGHVSEHAMDISQINGVLWTLAHLPVFVCSAGAGAVLHWAAIDPQENRWQIDERNLFLGFTCLLLFSLSLIMLLHGRLHNDRKHWWTKKYTRIFVRMALSIIMISGIQIKDHDNLWVLIYVCSFMTVDFIYEFVCKRAISLGARARGQGALRRRSALPSTTSTTTSTVIMRRPRQRRHLAPAPATTSTKPVHGVGRARDLPRRARAPRPSYNIA